MMVTPIWSDVERIAVHCFVEPDAGLATRPFQSALCRRAAELFRARVGAAMPVIEIEQPADAATAPPGTVVALIHARAQPAAPVIPGAGGLIVALSGRLMRNGTPAAGALFGAAPFVARMQALDKTAEIEAALAQLVAGLLSRG